MRMLVTVEFVDAGSETGTHDVLVVNRNAEFTESGDVGLSLAEGKQILNFVQHEFITAQAAEITERARICPRCGSRLVLKDVERRRVHTLFGRIALEARRWVSCGCN
jgi:DNA-directed RNA polymerase subunit RPC12/RpoP